MKKINILKENKNFERIIKNNKPYKYKGYIIYIEYLKNGNNIYHFGISVSKKLINAVGRNKIKRQLKNMIDKKIYNNNFNCIIIIRKSFLETSFKENSNDLYEIFNKLKIVKGEKYEEEKNI